MSILTAANSATRCSEDSPFAIHGRFMSERAVRLANSRCQMHSFELYLTTKLTWGTPEPCFILTVISEAAFPTSI